MNTLRNVKHITDLTSSLKHEKSITQGSHGAQVVNIN